jgi:hypothetical protein
LLYPAPKRGRRIEGSRRIQEKGDKAEIMLKEQNFKNIWEGADREERMER